MNNWSADVVFTRQELIYLRDVCNLYSESCIFGSLSQKFQELIDFYDDNWGECLKSVHYSSD